MHFVDFATRPEEMNVVACQLADDIFFFTTRSLAPGTELRVWFSRQFVERLAFSAYRNVSHSGELLLSLTHDM